MGNTPNIRFKGFTDDWEQRKLVDVVDVRSGRDYKHLEEGDIPVYGTGGYMLSVNEALSDDEDAIGIGRKGTIDNPYILRAPFWTVDTLFYAVPLDKYDLNFVFDIFQNVNWKAKDESTGVPSLSKATINAVETLMPEYAEQKKIGEYFSNLDNFITLHQRKCDETKKLKKFMLQKMFPKKDEKKPEIRFADFTDDWEQRKLGWLVDNDVIEAPKDGNHGEKHPTSDEYVEEGIPFLMASDIRNGRVDLENCKYITKERAEQLDKGFAREGDVLLTHKATIGEVAILEGLQEEYAMLTPQVTYYRILDNKRLSQKYLYAVFHSESFQNEMQTKAAQSTRPYIGISAQQNLTISLPCSTEEQQRIGEYFASLDTLITLHQRKCDEIKEIKKFMLQNMFPQKG